MLTAKPINFLHINAFNIINNWNVYRNEANTLYFILYDDILKTRQVFNNIVITVKFLSSNAHGEFITKIAAPVTPLDASLFKITLLPTDDIASGNVYFEAVIDGTTVRKWVLHNGLAVFDPDESVSSC